MKRPLLYGPTGRPIPRTRNRALTWDAAWEAAKRTGYRGYFYFPTLDPSEQLPEQTRTTIAAKVNWLYNNGGVVQPVIDGLGLEEVDTGLWPKATTSNPAFNKVVTDLFHHQCKDARFFHSAKQENFYSAQWLIRRSIRLYGDHFGQMLRSGVAGSIAKMHFVPSWQVANAETKLDQSQWTDGIRKDKFGAAVQYRTLTSGDRTKFVDVAEEDMLHFHDKFWTGQTRGTSGLAPVTRKLFSADDIEKAETSGTLLRTRLAYAITSKESQDGGPMLLPGVSSVEEIETQPENKTGKLLIQKIVSRDGNDIDVADLPPGRDIKVVESERSSAATEYRDFLLRDVAYSTLYPPEHIYFIAGITNGTVARSVQNHAQRVINTVRAFQLVPQFCERWYLFWLWQQIKAGRFDDVPGGVPADWYNHRIIQPKDMTVDVGREGTLYDKRFETGKMSGQKYHGLHGDDEEDVEDEVIEAAIRRRKKVQAAAAAAGMDLTYADVFPPPAGSTAPHSNAKDEASEKEAKSQ